MWIARDESGELWAFTHEPALDNKGRSVFFKRYDRYQHDLMHLNKDEFPEITFENSPVEITGLEHCYTVNEKKQDEFIQ
ncbi:MAG: hypothetical protein J6P44_02325 [Bacteroidales bacterium]|nr:hypothetical protein [Bacteroidales bacterium]